MPAVYCYRHIIDESEVDSDGYPSCLTYLSWTQSAAQAHSVEQGWSAREYHSIGAAWVVRSHHIEYLNSATVGEAIAIDTWVSNFNKTRCLRKYLIRQPDENRLLVTAETIWAFIDLTQRRPRRIPREIIDAFTLVPECDEPGQKNTVQDRLETK